MFDWLLRTPLLRTLLAAPPFLCWPRVSRGGGRAMRICAIEGIHRSGTNLPMHHPESQVLIAPHVVYVIRTQAVRAHERACMRMRAHERACARMLAQARACARLRSYERA